MRKFYQILGKFRSHTAEKWTKDSSLEDLLEGIRGSYEGMRRSGCDQVLEKPDSYSMTRKNTARMFFSVPSIMLTHAAA
jgi:hypothetical protein